MKTVSRILFRLGVVLAVLYALAALAALLFVSGSSGEVLGLAGFGLGIPALGCFALGWVVRPPDVAPLVRSTAVACAASLVVGLALGAAIVATRMHAKAQSPQNLRTAKIPCKSPLADSSCRVAPDVKMTTTTCVKDEFFCTAFVFTSSDGKSKYRVELTGIDAATKLVSKLNDGTILPAAVDDSGRADPKAASGGVVPCSDLPDDIRDSTSACMPQPPPGFELDCQAGQRLVKAANGNQSCYDPHDARQVRAHVNACKANPYADVAVANTLADQRGIPCNDISDLPVPVCDTPGASPKSCRKRQ